MKIFVLCLLTVVFINDTNRGRENTGEGFIRKLDQGEHVKIAALGTSLTGGNWPWLDVMKEWLDEEYPGLVEYQNEGVGASASSYPPGRSGLDKAKVVAAGSSDVVFIEFTVNDSYKPYNISVEESRKNLESMIHILREANPNVEIILQTMSVVIDMPELNMYESAKRPELTKYLNMYREVANERQLLIIDHFPNWKRYLKKEGRDTYIQIVTDGIHPNLDGYRKILLPELMKVLQQKK